MSVSQAEFAAFKAEAMDKVKKIEEVVTKAVDEIKLLQDATSLISLQAAPWSITVEAAVAASEAKAEAALIEVRALHEGTKAEVEDLRRRAADIEKKSWSTAANKTWDMSRPKDMEVISFGGKEESWAKFREQLMDYADACSSGIRPQLEFAMKQRTEITHQLLKKSPLGCADELWEKRADLYTLLKRKTEPTSEARKIIECVEKTDGYEAWRLLGVRYEPQGGMRRMKQLSELTHLQQKRCKHAGETAIILLEVDRHVKKIRDTGGVPPDDDVLINVLWTTMDAQTRSHVTGKVDMEEVTYAELRTALMIWTNLVASTTRGTPANGAVAMDISSIADANSTPQGGVDNGDEHGGAQQQDQQSHKLWALDEGGWPIDEEGWPIEGEFIEKGGQLNFVKGKGKGGKGGCHNCGDLNHYIRDCPKPRRPKGKGKGKADDRLCHGCGKGGHLVRDCPTNPSKGKGKASSYPGKGAWGPSWSSPNGIKSICAVKEVSMKAKKDPDGFVVPAKTVRPAAINTDKFLRMFSIIDSLSKEIVKETVTETNDPKEQSAKQQVLESFTKRQKKR